VTSEQDLRVLLAAHTNSPSFVPLAIFERSVRELLPDGRMPSYKIERARRIDAVD
jgi:hypothetical protein